MTVQKQNNEHGIVTTILVFLCKYYQSIVFDRYYIDDTKSIYESVQIPSSKPISLLLSKNPLNVVKVFQQHTATLVNEGVNNFNPKRGRNYGGEKRWMQRCQPRVHKDHGPRLRRNKRSEVGGKGRRRKGRIQRGHISPREFISRGIHSTNVFDRSDSRPDHHTPSISPSILHPTSGPDPLISPHPFTPILGVILY